MKCFEDNLAETIDQMESCSTAVIPPSLLSRRPENLKLECVVSIEELRMILQKPLLNEKEIEFVEREYLSQIDTPTFSLEVKVVPTRAKNKRALMVGATLEQSEPKAQVFCASPCQHCEVRESCIRNLL